MEIRKLQGKERFDAYLIETYCFHSRVEDPEKNRAQTESGTSDQWGAYSDDGKLMAVITNHLYRFMLDGREATAGGIGGVATLPEYRETGVIREIFRSVLRDAYDRGEVISALYPFNHAFYRKQGYDTVTYQNDYELNPALLNGYRFGGQVSRWQPGETVKPYLEVYNRFAAGFNFAMLRSEAQMEEHMKTDRLWSDRKFTYLFSLNGGNIAYLTFTDIRNDPAAILRVDECAWTCPEGFRAILSFLGRFGADYGTVQLPLPYGIDLLRIVRTSDAYGIRKTCRQDFMVRVINAKKLLGHIVRPAGCDLVIRVSDEIIAENNVTLRITERDAAETEAAPDLEVSVRTLGQLAAGCISPDEAMLKPDIRVFSNEEMFRKVFTEKKLFVSEHF